MVHVQLININIEKIPNIFKLEGHEIHVTKPGQSFRWVCTHCHKALHLEEVEKEQKMVEEEKMRLIKRKQF